LVDQADPPKVTSNEDDISDAAFANIAHVLAASTSTLRTLQDSRNHQEAQAHPDAHLWDLATQSEIQSLERMKTFVEVDELPPGRKAIEAKPVYKTKYDALGQVDRHKVRIVATKFLASTLMTPLLLWLSLSPSGLHVQLQFIWDCTLIIWMLRQLSLMDLWTLTSICDFLKVVDSTQERLFVFSNPSMV